MSAAIVALLLVAAPAVAELNTFYQGKERMSGKESPLKAAFCVDATHAVMQMQGARSFRMVFSAKENLLRMIDDTDKKVFAIDSKGLSGDMMAEMSQQLAQMPAAQREQAMAMMKSTMGAMKLPDPPHYVGTDEKQTVLDHECQRVNIFRGERRTGEYWGSTSKDFAMTPGEKANVVAMNRILGNLGIAATNVGGAGTRAFAWDTATDGYPLISRCVEDSTVILELQMVSFDHKSMDSGLWKIPSGYHEESLSGQGEGMGPHGKHGRGR